MEATKTVTISKSQKDDWQKRLTSSAHDFLSIVWPIIKLDFSHGKLVIVESVTRSHFAKDLDQIAGIDAWIVDRGNGWMMGLASRVQWEPKSDYAKEFYPYNTFSIRYETTKGGLTEYQKRRMAIENDLLYPKITCQAYLDHQGGNLLTVAHVYTEELIDLATQFIQDMNQGKLWFDCAIRIAPGGNKFIALSWQTIARRAESLKVYDETMAQ